MDEQREISDPKVGDRLDMLTLQALQKLPEGTVATYQNTDCIGIFTLNGRNWGGDIRSLVDGDSSVNVDFWMSKITTLPVVK